ncbi:SDR family oxidoreductase, partial [Acinetobacter baumannii]
MRTVSGKVAFITGGAGGIGLGLAKVLRRAGMHVAVSYRRPEQLEQARSEGLDPDVFAVRLDVTDRDAMAAAAREIVARFGKLHVLVNNAGVS